MGQRNSHPEPGDLIEIDRPLHQHWALYLGDGYVINLTPVGKNGIVALGLRGLPEYIRKVEKQRLKDVVGKNKWHINNESDQYCSPLPVEEIIRRAEGYIDKEVTFHVFGSNCERFVKTLRYGDQVRNFVCGEMNIPEMAQDKHNPSPGDLIEIKQPDIHHWALYMGDGYVIHVTSVDDNGPAVSASTETIVTRKGKVKKELLKDVVGNDEWCVNKKYEWLCTPLPVEEIIWRADSYIGKEVPYGVFGRKCGHFVKRLRYGGQVRNFVHGEMNIPEMARDKHNPSPGDLIEIKQKDIHHWALYVGKGYVIHVTAVDENAPPVSASTEKIQIIEAKVKKELLEEVVGNHEWCVNNKYDWFRTPLPVELIIQHAEGCIGKEVEYCLFPNGSEHFVVKLRYCVQMPQDMTNPDPGDLIEIKRKGYQHWALYMGKGYVIHVTAVDENAPGLSASTVTIVTRKAKVKKQLLTKVVENSKWYVNNKYDLKSCPYPVEVILRRAERWIDKEVPYRLFKSNCEHFVTMLRYGWAVSDQVLEALTHSHSISTAAGLSLASAISLATNPLLLAAAGVGVLASIGLISSTSHYIHKCLTFRRSQYDTIQEMCC